MACDFNGGRFSGTFYDIMALEGDLGMYELSTPIDILVSSLVKGLGDFKLIERRLRGKG